MEEGWTGVHTVWGWETFRGIPRRSGDGCAPGAEVWLWMCDGMLLPSSTSLS